MQLATILRGAGLAFFNLLSARIVGFAITALLAASMGAAGVGVYALAITTHTVATIVGKLGIDLAVLRFVGAEHGEGNWQGISRFARSALALSLSGAAVMTAVTFAFAPAVANQVFHEPRLEPSLRIMALAITPLIVLRIHAQLLKAIGKVGWATFAETLFVGMCMLSMLLLFPGSTFEMQPVTANAVFALALFFGAILSVYLWRRSTPGIKKLDTGWDLKPLLRVGGPLFGVTALNFVIQSTDIIMLGIWWDSGTVALYNVAVLIAGLIPFVLLSINQAAPPHFAALYRKGDYRQLTLLLRRLTVLSATLTLPAAILVILLRQPILGLFGDEFTPAGTALIILVVGQLVNVLTGPVGFLLMMTGQERTVRNTTWVAAVSNLTLNSLMIPSLGLIGAASASTICISVMHMTFALFSFRQLKRLRSGEHRQKPENRNLVD